MTTPTNVDPPTSSGDTSKVSNPVVHPPLLEVDISSPPAAATMTPAQLTGKAADGGDDSDTAESAPATPPPETPARSEAPSPDAVVTPAASTGGEEETKAADAAHATAGGAAPAGIVASSGVTEPERPSAEANVGEVRATGGSGGDEITAGEHEHAKEPAAADVEAAACGEWRCGVRCFAFVREVFGECLDGIDRSFACLWFWFRRRRVGGFGLCGLGWGVGLRPPLL